MALEAGKEKQAQDTATTKLKLAQARRSKTILTDPNDLSQVNVNKPTAMGVS